MKRQLLTIVSSRFVSLFASPVRRSSCTKFGRSSLTDRGSAARSVFPVCRHSSQHSAVVRITSFVSTVTVATYPAMPVGRSGRSFVQRPLPPGRGRVARCPRAAHRRRSSPVCIGAVTEHRLVRCVGTVRPIVRPPRIPRASDPAIKNTTVRSSRWAVDAATRLRARHAVGRVLRSQARCLLDRRCSGGGVSGVSRRRC